MYKTFYKLKEQSICQHQKEQILGARLKLILSQFVVVLMTRALRMCLALCFPFNPHVFRNSFSLWAKWNSLEITQPARSRTGIWTLVSQIPEPAGPMMFPSDCPAVPLRVLALWSSLKAPQIALELFWKFFISLCTWTPLAVSPPNLLWFQSSTSFSKIPFSFLELKPAFALGTCFPEGLSLLEPCRLQDEYLSQVS